MIRLITGLPGHGKTLWTVSQLLAERARDDSRPLRVDGIRGLTVPHVPIEGIAWQDAADGSLIVIDEAQRVFPTRGAGTPPAHVAALSTHRHRGIDIWLVTQHPGNIDSYVRERLIEEHIHVMRVMGSESAMVYRWNEVETDPRSESAKAAALVEPWRYPKEVYNAYSSAVLHTAKRRIPWRKVLLVACGLLAPVLFVVALAALPGQPEETVPDVAQASPGSPQAAPAAAPILTAEEWLARYTPRIEYRPESAPAYDRYMADARPPRVFCVDVKDVGCSCYTEQATRWTGINQATCKRVARNGIYEPREQ